MMTEVCDICNNTDETIRYIKDGYEYNLCRKCMRLVLVQLGISKLFRSTVAFNKECLEDCERYMRGEER